MKKRTTKLILAVTAAILLITTLAVTLTLTMCDYEEPDLSEYGNQLGNTNGQIEEVNSPYGMFDYSKRPFFTDAYYAGMPYKNDIYYMNMFMELTKVSLGDIGCDLKTDTEIVLPESTSVCPVVAHQHGTFSLSLDCPGWVNGGSFLLDAYESAGDFSIFYYVGVYREATNPAGDWGPYETYDLYRYDSGENVRELLYASPDPIGHAMSYDQSVYFVTQTAANEYSVNRIAKSGGEVTTISVGNDGASFLGVYDEQIIFRDGDATIYKADFDLKNCEEIYQVEEDLSLSMNVNGFASVFVHDGYLYFCADYEAIPFELTPTQSMNLFKHSIRRLPLNDLDQEGEIVAPNVLDDSMFGIVDDVFYYAPCEPGETLDRYYWNWNEGQLKGVDLNTLEEVYFNEDCGLVFASTCTVMCGDGILDTVFRLDDRYNIPYEQTGGIRCIYDIKTGALCPLYATSG